MAASAAKVVPMRLEGSIDGGGQNGGGGDHDGCYGVDMVCKEGAVMVVVVDAMVVVEATIVVVVLKR